MKKPVRPYFYSIGWREGGAVNTHRSSDLERYQLLNNERFHKIMCILLLCVECFMLLVYCVSQTPGKPSLDPGYLVFYTSAIGVTLVQLAVGYILHIRKRSAVWVQYAGLHLLLLWGCLFSIYDVMHGNGGVALPQLMLFTSAGLRFPKWLHCGINAAYWSFYLLLLWNAPLEEQAFYSEAINSGIYLLIAAAMIYVATAFQEARFQAIQKILKMQNDSLDIMAEQVKMVQEVAEKGRIIRHDMRHIVFVIRENAARRDYEAVLEVAEQTLREIEQARIQTTITQFTKVPEIDAPLSRCVEWAEKMGIQMSVAMQTPSGIDLRAFALVLLNALENACIAVKAQSKTADRRIDVVGKQRMEQYYFEISNTYRQGSVSISPKDGLPVSGREGHGYGTKSIAQIVERHGGHYRFCAGEKFCLQVLFPTQSSE